MSIKKKGSSPKKAAAAKNAAIKQTTKKTAAKKDSSPDEKKKEEQPKISVASIKFYTVLFFSLSILLLILVFFRGTSGWYMLHKFIRGLFGICILVFPAGFLWLSYKLDKSVRDNKVPENPVNIKLELLKIAGIAVVLCGFGQTMLGEVRTDSFIKAFTGLYKTGISFKSAGAMSSLLAFPLIRIIGKYGAKIVIIFLTFIVIMWVLGISIGQLFGFLKSPVRTIESGIAKLRNKDDLRMTEDEWNEISNTKELPKITEKAAADEIEAAPPKKTKPKNESFRHNGVDFIMDIDIPEESEFVPENGSTEPTSAQNEISENSAVKESAADSLEEMIKRAMKEPETKKMKQQEKADMMLSVNEEFRKRQNSTDSSYQIPPLDFLEFAQQSRKDQTELREKGQILQDTFTSFGIKAQIDDITMGPTVIRYEVRPAPGVKVSKITSLADDIALNLAASGVRIEAPIPGKSAIGIEVPNNNRDTVSLRELIESEEFQSSKSKLAFAVGKDISGKAIIGDIAKMPHVIIAGSTGSGKSVCTNSIIMSILYHASPSEVKLILIDPKIVEFRVYDGIPHLLIPVVTDPKKAAGALNWAVQEMLRRYQVFAQTGVRDLADYNAWCSEEGNESQPMPQIVITIDELADLMMAASKEVEDAICRLAQMARAAGMHLIIATQRPTTDIITGLIKANVPSRIALSVMSNIDSRTILDTGGAEKLLGHGDMLYFPSGMPKPVRIQGCFVSTKEIEKAVEFIKSQVPTDYSTEIMQAVEENVPTAKGEKSTKSENEHGDYSNDDKELINRALDIITDMGQASISSLQRRLKLGYARAARIMDELEEMGVIGPSEGAKPRKVKITREQAESYKIRQ